MSNRAAILLIDDNPSIARAVEIAFRIAGHRLDIAVSPEDAHSRLARGRYDAILLDLNFTPGETRGAEGLACLDRIVADDPAACVVVITAHSGIRLAVTAMQAGARDFVVKPWRNADLIAKVEAAIARPAMPPPSPSAPVQGEAPAMLLGDSAAIARVRDLIRRVAPTTAGVVITGPPGSGRSLAARAIHAGSRDAGAPVSRIDLRDRSAWDMLDGATGSAILRHADGLDPVEQDRLLDRLPPSLRTIAIAEALAPLVPALQRRLATVEIAMPPLAARADDAVVLARHFARLAAERFGRPAIRLGAAAETMIRRTVWPDEVRGLALAVERAVLLAPGPTIEAAAFAGPPASTASTALPAASFDLSNAERAMIEAALLKHRHNVSHAAAALGLSRGALYRRMARYGL